MMWIMIVGEHGCYDAIGQRAVGKVANLRSRLSKRLCLPKIPCSPWRKSFSKRTDSRASIW
jgi:hypothetical protein